MNYLSALIVLASVVIPSGIAIGIFWIYRKWQDRDGRRSPIENRRIFGAGENLRKRIENHTDEMMLGLTMLFFLGPSFMALWAMQRLDWHKIRFGFWDAVLLSVFLLMTGSSVWRIFKNGQQRRIASAGLKAELYTAQELNRLMALGCTVLHDVPADNFNIDHVVIGPRAIYAVETKSVRKPPATDAKDHFKVVYDGQLLRFPDFSDKKRLQQTKRQADWLSNYLRNTVGKALPVVPALALPGWWIDITPQAASGEVRVFNPAGRGANFMADHREILVDSATSSLVTQALVMRYPIDVGEKST
jgi:hypothetical protein